MADREIIIDLYGCSGGAAMGYYRAGFAPYCVDIVDRPNNPFPTMRANALDVLGEMAANDGMCTFNGCLIRPVLAHASPPCQADNPQTKGTNRANGWGREHVSLTAPTRELLDATGLPYVIEQPTGSGEVRRDLMLCMGMFDIYTGKPPPWVQRHREFELKGFTVPQPWHPKHQGYVRGMRHGVLRDGPYVAAYGKGGGKATVPEMQHALGIDWTDVHEELTEAIPPDYTQYIGEHAMKGISNG
jgi:hypothetical protein